MDQYNEKEQQEVKLEVSENIRSYLYDSSKWCNFLGTLGLFGAALMIGMSLFFKAPIPSTAGSLGIGGLQSVMGIVFLLYGLIFIYPSFLLLKFANKTKEGILYANQQSFEEGLDKLRALFKFWGILAIIGIALNVLSFLGRLFV